MIGFHKTTEPFEFNASKWFEHEKPSVLEAFRTLGKEGYYITISGHDYDMRKKRLEEEYEKNPKAPGSAKNCIKEDSVVINPSIKEAASQFNDALLDEQAKKIEKLTKENEDWKSWNEMQNRAIAINNIAFRNEKNRLGKEIARLNGIIHKKNMKIEELRKESSRHLRGKIKVFYENEDLEGKLKDKDAVLSDVAEELRLTKIREKNLTEVCQKYMKENEELKKELADKVVDKIDAQALKSAESALAEKDEVIADLSKELKAQKDLVDDISLKYDGAKHNLKLRMDECEKLKNELEEKNYLIDMLRCGSREYCEYGIAAEKMIKKMAKVIVEDRAIDSEDYKEYRRWANGYRFNPQLPELSEEEEKKLTAKTLDFNAKCMKAARESINEVFESYAAKYAKNTLDELKEKAYESFNAKAHNLGLVGSKDGNGLLNQMAGIDKAEEGGDQSAIIVQCDNGITLSKEEAEIIERCTKNGTELHYSEKDGLTYTNMYGEEIPIRCLRGMFHVFTDEEIKNMKK